MTHRTILPLDQIQFFATSAYPCSYLEGHLARSQVATPPEKINTCLYSQLVQHGFRRSGVFVYRPLCDCCQACMSIRVPVAQFLPNRTQRRAYLRHRDLVVRIVQPHYSEEHYDLYRRYQEVRHADGSMNQDGSAQYVDFMVQSRVDSFMVEFREPASHGTPNELRMVSIVDKLSDGLSAVYTFYDPEPRQSLGTFNVLWQIKQALTLGLPYLYLGYWIEQSRKMSYKSNFQPFEILQDGRWIGGSSMRSNTSIFTK